MWKDKRRRNFILGVRLAITYVYFKWTAKQNGKWVVTGFEKERWKKLFSTLSIAVAPSGFYFEPTLLQEGGIAMGKSNTYKAIITNNQSG